MITRGNQWAWNPRDVSLRSTWQWIFLCMRYFCHCERAQRASVANNGQRILESWGFCACWLLRFARNDNRQHEKNRDKRKIDKRNREKKWTEKGRKRKKRKNKGREKKEKRKEKNNKRSKKKKQKRTTTAPKGGNGVCQRHRFSTTGVVAWYSAAQSLPD